MVSKEQRMVQKIGSVEFLASLVKFLGLTFVLFSIFVVSGWLTLTVYHYRSVKQLQGVLITFSIYCGLILVAHLLMRKVWLPNLKQRIAKQVYADTEKQIFTDNAGHSLEVCRLKKDSVWRDLVFPYKEARQEEREMGLPEVPEKKLTRAEAQQMRDQHLKAEYNRAETKGLGYAAPFYLRCYGSPQIEPLVIDERDGGAND
ncbi:hypothetical protein [Lactiplantibacillus plantarum]|uniref:hypothetical protein n=1 Tax=Lactiplantibacillus plantarum TaxID=1590 RepID=UPI001BAD4E56|nr:hypothetical protein [Lactiplantibacillus plantarum]MBS0955431.1 hypothetical protein [Lactiplantibacillus plantarum]